MKFTFKNLGPIKSAEMRLGQLTVIAGENNVGKTYLSYALYGFLRMMADKDNAFRPSSLFYRDRILPGIVRRTMGRRVTPRYSTATLSLSEVEQNVRVALRHYSKIFSRAGIDDVFSSKHQFPEFSLNCDIASILWPKRFGDKMSQQEMRKIGIPYFPALVGDIEVCRDGDNIIFSAENARYPKDVDKAVALSIISGWVLGKIMPEPFIISAERFGISLFYKELDFSKSRLVEMLQNMPGKVNKIDAPIIIRASSARYAQPIKDNIDYTRGLGEIQKEIGKMNKAKLFDDIKVMMDGHYRHDDYETHFISKARKKGAFRIPLHLASSSARGLSDFYFYLKHTAYPGQLLIVDEPETHLHPVNQIQVARLLARCANAGLRVLITTHSDYIVKELNNLIMLSQDFKGKSAFLSKHKKHYDENDYLKKSDVCAYVCENGGLTECEIDSRGMIMDSFNDPILEIDRISKELDARLPEEE